MQNIPLALKKFMRPHLLKNRDGKEKASMAKNMQQRFTCFAAFSLLLLSIFQCSDIHRSAAEASEVMPVTIRASARWEEIVRDGNGKALYRNYGFLTVSMSGTMALRDSPIVARDGIMVMPTENYAPQNIAVSAVYEEGTEDMEPPEERKCPNPVILSYQGSCFASVTDGLGLMICNFSSAATPFMQNLSPKEQEFAAQIGSSMTPDFYQFSLSGDSWTGTPREPKVTGIRLKSEDCDFEHVEKSFPGFSIGIQMKLPPSGSMSGYRIWSADTDGKHPPSFGIHVSDMADHGGEAPYHPAEGGRRNVTYSISWNFGGHSPAPGATAESDDEEEEDCEELQRRVNEISIIMAAYSNASIRDYVNDQDFDLATKKQIYQEAIENAFMDAIKNNSEVTDQINRAANVDGESVTPFESRDPSGVTGNDLEDDGETLCQSEALEKKQSQTNMEAVAGGNLDGGENVWGHDLGSVTIVDHCTGSPVQIEVYDRNGNVVYNQGVHDAVACWQEKYGDEAGRSRFEASLEHERTHVDQYVKNGPIDSIDELAQRELEAYQKEMNEILEDMMDLDC